MPLDGKVEAFTPGKFLGGHAGLRQLAEALRRPLPGGFRWDYGTEFEKTECGTVGCALGLAVTLWPELALGPMPHERDDDDEVDGVFGLSVQDFDDIFYDPIHTYGKLWQDVTPGDVADAIDRYLAP